MSYASQNDAALDTGNARSILMEALLFEVTPNDPLTFVAVTIGLLTIVAAASYFPARRATLVDPVEALRAE